MKEFRLPDPGEGLTEAEIVSWKVNEGDQVKVNDVVVEVETSKSLVELPIPWAGKVTKILVAEGDTVDVGTPIIVIDDGSGDELPAAPASESSEAAKPERTPNLVGYGPREASTQRRPRKGASQDQSAQATKQQVNAIFGAEVVGHKADERVPFTGDSQSTPRGGAPLPDPGVTPHGAASVPATKVLAKPPVRKLAKDLGVDLGTLTGSGPGGIITRDDVQQAAVGAAASAAPAYASPGGPSNRLPLSGGLADRRVPIKGVRKHTAEAMVRSAFTAPHVTEWVTCDATATMELLDRLRQRREFRDVRISPLLVIARACCLALARNPEVNASWDQPNQEIVYHGEVNLGIAAATPRGLMVPNIKGAGRMGLLDLAQALNQLVGTAKEGRSQPHELSGGTFTITNVGIFGVDGGTPILNPPEAAILAMGAIERRPWVVGTGTEERIEPRWVTTLALSFDHRLVDGEQGSKFLADVAALVTDPGLAML